MRVRIYKSTGFAWVPNFFIGKATRWLYIHWILWTIVISGCAALPDSIPVEVQHTSHISQHFGSHCTNYGWNTVFVGAKWNNGPVSIELRDGYSMEQVDHRHEVFEANIRYEFKVKK